MAKRSTRYLALLRGINVGGKNIFGKDDLRQCFENLGYTNVRTYIQSGNILFRSAETSARKLTAEVERGLSDRFSYDAQAAVLSHRKYRTAVETAPAGWGTDESQKHHAAFTLAGMTPHKLLSQLPPPKDAIESLTPGPGVLFWSVSKRHLTKTTLMKLPQHPVYQRLTLRNHNTVFRLLELFDDI